MATCRCGPLTHFPEPVFLRVVVTAQGGAVTAAFRSLKQRFTFLLPRFGLMEALEAAKVSRLILRWGDDCGCPNVMP